MIPKTILITGATGLIGSRLTELLVQKGYSVRHLGRKKRQGNVPAFVWDIASNYIEEGALEAVDSIIHLAGAGIADEPWTEKRKREILESRTHSTALLYHTLKNKPNQVKSFISASAIGYYGFEKAEKVYTEEDESGRDFLAEVVRKWEAEVDMIENLNIRTVKIRVGIVLSEKGGALKEIAKPVRLFAGAPLGSGDQAISWIHLDDLCALFIYALENISMKGAYNGVTPHYVSNRELTRCIANVLRRPLLLPNIPAFVMRIMLGEMANLVLNGNKVSADKIVKAGFTFKYPHLQEAVRNLLARPG